MSVPNNQARVVPQDLSNFSQLPSLDTNLHQNPTDNPLDIHVAYEYEIPKLSARLDDQQEELRRIKNKI